MVMRVVIGAPVITECGGGQCRAAREAHVRQSDPSSPLIAPRLPLLRDGGAGRFIDQAVEFGDCQTRESRGGADQTACR
jgi:hypothetical protein